jgi:hypothetical protein
MSCGNEEKGRLKAGPMIGLMENYFDARVPGPKVKSSESSACTIRGLMLLLSLQMPACGVPTPVVTELVVIVKLSNSITHTSGFSSSTFNWKVVYDSEVLYF